MEGNASNIIMRLIKLVGDATSVPVWLILSERRDAPVYRSRAIVAYIAHKVLKIPSVEVGRSLARDHSTVLHACKIAEQMISDASDDARLILGLSEAARELNFEYAPEFAVDRLIAAYSALSAEDKLRFMSHVAFVGATMEAA